MKASIPTLLFGAALASLAACQSRTVERTVEPAGTPNSRWEREHALIEGYPKQLKSLPFSGQNALVLEVGRQWVREEAGTSNSRLFQFRLPGASGAGDANFTAYWFSGAGGTVEANLERWASQFETSTADPLEDAHITYLGAGSVKLSRIQMIGRYVAETSPGSGEHFDQADWAMDAAVMETPQGPLFLKVVGPEKTIVHHAASLDWMFSTARVEKLPQGLAEAGPVSGAAGE